MFLFHFPLIFVSAFYVLSTFIMTNKFNHSFSKHQFLIFPLLPSTKKEVNALVRVCLFVCLFARLLKKRMHAFG